VSSTLHCAALFGHSRLRALARPLIDLAETAVAAFWDDAHAAAAARVLWLTNHFLLAWYCRSSSREKGLNDQK
jgi:hypothetical protein